MSRISKAVLLAGGSGSRLFPLTKAVNKHLLPIFDKPLIYYPLSTLMLADIREVLIVTTPSAIEGFEDLLGDGSSFGISITFALQDKPRGLSDALLAAESFIDGEDFCLALGDNIFFSSGLTEILGLMFGDRSSDGAALLTVGVKDPERFGVVAYDKSEKPTAIIEKPSLPPSNKVVTGLYRFPGDSMERARRLRPSVRGEIEITDLLNTYFSGGETPKLFEMPRGGVWFDAGTNASMYSATEFVQSFQESSGSKIGSPEEVAIRKGWINFEDLHLSLEPQYHGCPYMQYLEPDLKND